MIQAIAEQIKQNNMTQYWSLVKSTGVSTEIRNIINQKIDLAIEDINQTQELEKKTTVIETLLKDAANLLVELGKNEVDDDITLTLQYLAMLEDFYQGLFWLEKIENSRATLEIYWSILYSCVDRLEGVLYRIKTIQSSIDIGDWNEILFLIESVFKEVLQIELEQKKEEPDFNSEKIVIRRAVLSGLHLITEIQNQQNETQKWKRREVALHQLKTKIEQRKIQPFQEIQKNINMEEPFYQQMDSFRPNGWKLYHQ